MKTIVFLFITLLFSIQVIAQSVKDKELILAAKDGDLAKVNALLISGAKANANDSLGYTPLIYASAYGYTDIMLALIQKGAYVNYNVRDVNPVFAAVNNDNPAALKILLDAKAEINCKDSKGYTPLMFAAQEGYTSSVEFLLNKGASINLESNLGHTALSIAIQNNRMDVVRLLLRYSPKKNGYKIYGTSPINTAEYLQKKEALTLLKKYGMKNQRQAPSLSSISVGIGMTVTPYESLINYELGLHEYFYKIDWYFAYSNNPDSSLSKLGNNSTIYNVTTNYYTSLNKSFDILPLKKSYLGVSIGCIGAWYSGKNKVKHDSKSQFLYGINPGICLRARSSIVKINYNYLFAEKRYFYHQQISFSLNILLVKLKTGVNYEYSDKTLYML